MCVCVCLFVCVCVCVCMQDKRKVAAQAASLFPQDSLAHSYAKEGLGDFKITELLGMQHYLQERGIDRYVYVCVCTCESMNTIELLGMQQYLQERGIDRYVCVRVYVCVVLCQYATVLARVGRPKAHMRNCPVSAMFCLFVGT